MLTLSLSIGAPSLLGNSLEPSFFNPFETAIALEKVFAADVDRPIVFTKGDAPSASKKYDARQEQEEDEKERRKDDEEREEQHSIGVAWWHGGGVSGGVHEL